jgi:hypothetical protein
MRPPLAPIEAGPAQDAGRTLAATLQQGIDIDPDAAQQLEPGAGHHAGVCRELRVTSRHQCVGERDAEPAGEMVVAGARRAQRRVPRADGEWPRRLQS